MTSIVRILFVFVRIVYSGMFRSVSSVYVSTRMYRQYVLVLACICMYSMYWQLSVCIFSISQYTYISSVMTRDRSRAPGWWS